MGILVCSLLWVMQGLYHEPYHLGCRVLGFRFRVLGLGCRVLGFRSRVMGLGFRV